MAEMKLVLARYDFSRVVDGAFSLLFPYRGKKNRQSHILSCWHGLTIFKFKDYAVRREKRRKNLGTNPQPIRQAAHPGGCSNHG